MFLALLAIETLSIEFKTTAFDAEKSRLIGLAAENIIEKNETIKASSNDEQLEVKGEKGQTVNVMVKATHALVIPMCGNGTLSVDFLNEKKVAFSRKYTWNKPEDAITFLDGGKYTMKVTFDPSDNTSIADFLVLTGNPTKRYIGETKNDIKVELKKGETGQLCLFGNATFTLKDVKGLVYADLSKATLADESLQGFAIKKISVAEGKESGSMTITSNSQKENAITYTTSDIPAIAHYGDKEITNVSDGDQLFDDISAGAIAGIVLGCFCLFLILFIVAWAVVNHYCCCKKEDDSKDEA